MPFKFDNSYARLPDAFYVRTKPTPVSKPSLIRVNRPLAEELGVDAARLATEGLDVLAGNRIADGSEPLAMAYAGHQFGGFVPQLGDGRALLLGEVMGCDGVRRDVQLKGSGPTPFSRRGDGRSALGPVLREYIVSEAMHALGVPSTRALAAVASGDTVYRETPEPGGVFTRVARSHVRVGTFEWFAARQDHENLRVLADYVIARHYPDAMAAENAYRAFFDGVIARQAELVAQWMSLGFIHGVMNTDNMNISGETIDFGPCAFMDVYHPKKKFSSIDHQGRYAFANQGPIAHWNLVRLAETLLPLFDADRDRAIEVAEDSLKRFTDLHEGALQRRFAAKLGIASGNPDDWSLAQSLLTCMAEGQADFTLVFRRLAVALADGDDGQVAALFTETAGISDWLQRWRERVAREDRTAVLSLMRAVNPVYLPRNHRVEAAIRAAYAGDYELFDRLNDVLQHPFTERDDAAEFELPPAADEVVRHTFCGT